MALLPHQGSNAFFLWKNKELQRHWAGGQGQQNESWKSYIR